MINKIKFPNEVAVNVSNSSSSVFEKIIKKYSGGMIKTNLGANLALLFLATIFVIISIILIINSMGNNLEQEYELPPNVDMGNIL